MGGLSEGVQVYKLISELLDILEDVILGLWASKGGFKVV